MEMKRRITNGRVYVDGHFENADIVCDDGVIAEISGKNVDEDAESAAAQCKNDGKEEVYDAQGRYVVPGFFDIHCHGAFGYDVNASCRDDFQKMGHFKALHGTTSWLCSILTDTREQTLHSIREARAHMEDHEDCANLEGIHLEGPFLEKEFKGAMPEHLLRKADYGLIAEYQEAANGNIRYITVAPLVEGVPELIPQMAGLGIVVAIGHSGADYDTAMNCIQAGAKCATHTFNAMRLLHQHEPAILGACLESDIYCEAICDGLHLHPGTIRLLLKVKGFDRVIAVTDSIMAAGLPDGRYKLGVNDIIVKNTDARLANADTRAGSTLTMDRALRNIIRFTGRPLEDVLPLLTINPARAIGTDDRIGSLEKGKEADIVILDDEYQVKDTMVKGRWITK